MVHVCRWPRTPHQYHDDHHTLKGMGEGKDGHPKTSIHSSLGPSLAQRGGARSRLCGSHKEESERKGIEMTHMQTP